MNLEHIQTLEETKDQTVEIDIIDLGIDEEIQKLILVKDELFVICTNKILKICVRECPKKVEIKKKRKFENVEGFCLRKCIKSKINHSIYILFGSYKKSQSIIYECKCTTMQMNKKTKINKNLYNFKVDPEDPSIFYSFYDMDVFKVSMETDSNEEDSRPDTETMGNPEKKENEPLLEKRQTEYKQKENKNIELFHKDPVNSVKEFSFDKNKKFFFTYYRREINKYDWKTKKLLHSFKRHKEHIQQLIFTEDFSLMIR